MGVVEDSTQDRWYTGVMEDSTQDRWYTGVMEDLTGSTQDRKYTGVMEDPSYSMKDKMNYDRFGGNTPLIVHFLRPFVRHTKLPVTPFGHTRNGCTICYFILLMTIS